MVNFNSKRGYPAGKEPDRYTLQGTNISHLGKTKIIFKSAFVGDMLVPRRIYRLPCNLFVYKGCKGQKIITAALCTLLSNSRHLFALDNWWFCSLVCWSIFCSMLSRIQVLQPPIAGLYNQLDQWPHLLSPPFLSN